MEKESSCSRKSKNRLERKKRKAAAFLDLVKSEPKEIDSSDVLCSPSKKVKTETNGGIDDKNNKPSQIAVKSENECKKKTMSDEMYAEYLKVIRAKQKQKMQRPKIFLTLDEMTRDFPCDKVTDGVKEVPPVFMSDLQNLLLFSLQGNMASEKPRWCQLLRVMKVTKVITVVLDSLSKDEFEKHADHLPTLKSAFDVNVKLVAPAQYGSTVREDLLVVPFSIRQLKTKFEDLSKKAIEDIKNKAREVKMATEKRLRDNFDVTETQANLSTAADSQSSAGYKYDKRLLMLATDQMIREGIPMPYDTENSIYKDFVYSKSTPYKTVDINSPMFAVDCEMVQTTESKMDLARVSIVNENLEVVYDTYVKPSAKILDYVTRYSGITPRILESVHTTVKDVQKKLDSLLPADAILCGQSIGGDLRSMKIFHPYVIDTSVIYNLSGHRQMKTGLKRLAAYFLDKTIQDNDMLGHSSVEDAATTMELVQLKLQNDLLYGDQAFTNAMIPYEAPKTKLLFPVDTLHPEYEALKKQRLFFQQEGKRFVDSFITRIGRQDKTGVVIDEDESEDFYNKETLVLHCDTDKRRRKQTIQSCKDVDFCLTFLYGYRDFLAKNTDTDELQENEIQRCLWVLDRHIWKILRKTQENALFTVILTGRQGHEGYPKAMAFSKIV